MSFEDILSVIASLMLFQERHKADHDFLAFPDGALTRLLSRESDGSHGVTFSGV